MIGAMRTWTVAAVLVAGVVVGGCSGDDGGDRGDRSSTTEVSQAAELARRLGCGDVTGSTGLAGGAWLEADVRQCVVGDAALVRIFASLTSPQRAAAVRLLSMEGDPDSDGASCPAVGTTPGGIFVVAGDTWVAAVRGRDGAMLVAERLDGQVQPGQINTPISYPIFDCLPGSTS
jgi:hypothetical protein